MRGSGSSRAAAGLVALLALAAAPARSQMPTPSVDVGQVAPDFELPGATRYGVLAEPVRLSDFKGSTVVLAFFPRARTRGCTVQMESYRDQHATLFKGGKNVVVIAASTDPDTALASWARDADFPMLFVSDVEGLAGKSYGVFDEARKYDRRVVYVIDAEGRVTYRAAPFRELTEEAYTELGRAVSASLEQKGR